MKLLSRSLHSLLVFLFLQQFIFAGVGGKISGTVTSEDQGVLVGVNVVIDGTHMGTATDEKGEFFILNVPPGTYSVKFMMIGYKIAVHQDVQVVSDFTTKVNAALELSTLDAREEVYVVATRPLIQRDATATIRVIGADDIISMPVDNINDILATQAGFTTDESGDIHVRGGRTKEILYMIDGVIVRDPMEGDFSGTVNQNAIQEMTVISGTFNAEYGQAMSGIVNIVTKDGDYLRYSGNISLSQGGYNSGHTDIFPQLSRLNLNNISDFYKIRYEDIIGLEKIIPGKDGKKESKISFKEKTASNIINGINESKKIPFARVIFALGIRYVGETVAKKLATSFKTIDNISSASYEELVEVDEIGERIANSVIAWFSKDEHKQIISELKNVGLNHEIDVSSENISNILDGKTFVVSGVFENHSRDELKALVENNGGKNTSSISSKTGYVIAGENMGPAKKAKAEKFGIPILSESDFIELISNN